MGTVTWEDVVKYIDDKYIIGRVGDMIKLTFMYPEDEIRKQVVFVGHYQQPDGLYVEVQSRVGRIIAGDLPDALEAISDKPLIALKKIDNLYYVRVTLDMNYVPMSDIDKIVALVSRTADALEKEFCGGDEN